MPISYYTDTWMFNRRMRKKAAKPGGGKAAARVSGASLGRPHLHRRAGPGERLHRPPAAAIRRAVIVDPGDEPERLLQAIEQLGVQIEAILITHCHFDHIGAVAPLARATGAPVYCPEIERPVLADIMQLDAAGVRAVREL